ncbi:hypothetical protein J132_00543, partial [Termitomyces sp. J132]
FWWPQVCADTVWYFQTYHLCQVHQMTKVLILPTVAMPAPLFSKIYVDTMFMLPSNKFKYIIQGCCSLTHYPEFCMLTRENTKAIIKWLYEDIVCCWRALSKIVTDNGPPILKAVTYLAKKYNLHHIWISGYNKCVNSIVKRPHFNVRQALFKVVDGDQSSMEYCHLLCLLVRTCYSLQANGLLHDNWHPPSPAS